MSERRWWRAVGVAATMLCAGLPGPANAAATPRPQQSGGSGTWTVLVYNLNDAIPSLPIGVDIDEMVEASKAGVTFIVYFDTSLATDLDLRSVNIPTTDEAVLVRVENGVAKVERNMGELDSGSPKTLGWFIATGIAMAEADRYALVIGDHGSSWQGIAFDEDVRLDGSTRKTTSMDAAEFQTALKSGLRGAGVDRFEMIITDACLMASYEFAAHIAPYAEYLISSEEVIPGPGMDYRSLVSLADLSLDVPAHFSKLATAFAKQTQSLQPESADSITLSLIDLDQMPAIDSALRSFVTASAAELDNDPIRFYTAGQGALEFGSSGGGGFVDISDFLTGLGSGLPKGLENARAAFIAAIDRAVLSTISGAAQKRATGMSIYFPKNPANYDFDYDKLAAGQVWRGFLSDYYDALAAAGQAAGAPEFTGDLEITPAGDRYLIVAPVSPGATGFGAEAIYLVGRPQPNGEIVFFEASDTEISDGTAVGEFFGTLNFVTDGTSSLPVFTEYTLGGGGWSVLLRFQLTDVNGNLSDLFWEQSGNGSQLFTLDSSGALASYTPSPGDVATPKLLVQSADGATRSFKTFNGSLDAYVPWETFNEPLDAGLDTYVEMILFSYEGDAVDVVSTNLEIGS